MDILENYKIQQKLKFSEFVKKREKKSGKKKMEERLAAKEQLKAARKRLRVEYTDDGCQTGDDSPTLRVLSPRPWVAAESAKKAGTSSAKRAGTSELHML